MEVPCQTREAFIYLHKKGKYICGIGKIFEKSPGTIHYINARYREVGNVDRPHSGCPEKLNTVQKCAVLKEVHRNPSTSAPEIAGTLRCGYNITVTPQTVQNTLKKCGMHGCILRNKPYISKKNKEKCL